MDRNDVRMAVKRRIECVLIQNTQTIRAFARGYCAAMCFAANAAVSHDEHKAIDILLHSIGDETDARAVFDSFHRESPDYADLVP